MRHGVQALANRQILRRGLMVMIAAIAIAACSEPTPVGDDQPLSGAVLYEANCEACHGGATGGQISDIPPPHNAEGHTWHHPDCLLVDIVQDGLPPRIDMPDGVAPMPAFGEELSAEEIGAILDHIKTWWTEEQRDFQEDISRRLCD